MSSRDEDLLKEFERLFWNLSIEKSYLWQRISEEYFPETQSQILYFLDREGPKKMSFIADSLHLTAGSISMASDKLIENGYIERVRDENDRRVVYLSKTPKGRETLDKIKSQGHRIIKFVFNDASDDDLKYLIDTYQKASDRINMLYEEYE